jgi:hypothetical protein
LPCFQSTSNSPKNHGGWYYKNCDRFLGYWKPVSPYSSLFNFIFINIFGISSLFLYNISLSVFVAACNTSISDCSSLYKFILTTYCWYLYNISVGFGGSFCCSCLFISFAIFCVGGNNISIDSASSINPFDNRS